nr:hypothetical protein [uncultured Acetatifactor sp.]
MGEDRKYDDYDNGSLGAMGYQAQEFDQESGELMSSEEDEDEDEDFEEDEDLDYESDSEDFDGGEDF